MPSDYSLVAGAAARLSAALREGAIGATLPDVAGKLQLLEPPERV